MNTYRIFEEFRASLGEPAAKALAETLGSMFEEMKDTVTKAEFRALTETIDSRASRMETAIANLAEAQARTEARIGELAEAQARTEARVEQLAKGQVQLWEAQGRLEERMGELAGRMGELADAQARTEARVEQLAKGQVQLWEAQGRLEERMDQLTERMDGLTVQMGELADAVKTTNSVLERLTIRTDAVVGRTFELQFRDRLTAYLGRFMRRGKLLANDTLLDTIEPVATDDEIDDFLRADAVASGLIDGVPSHVVIEVSSVGDFHDIERAQRRAAILGRAGLATVALVACEAISPESLAFARMKDVRIWCNGSLLESAA
jgi:predicted nuclease with TOPRIM domain